MNVRVWEPVTTTAAAAGRGSLLEDLHSGACPAVIVRSFYPPAHCAEIVSTLDERGDELVRAYLYPGHDTPYVTVRNVGCFLMQHLDDPGLYFEEAARSERLFDELFASVDDPRRAIRDFVAELAGGWSVDVASEDDGRRYASCIIRVHEDGDGAPIHRDRALADASGYCVARLRDQLSAVLSLQRPSSGGEVVIYSREWEPELDARKSRGTLGYPAEVVEGSASFSIAGEPGDLYLLNPGFFHEIKPSFGDRRRVALGTFFARDPDTRSVRFWS